MPLASVCVRALVLVLLPAVGAACAARGGRPSEPPLSRDAAIRILETTEVFADTAIGFAGEPSAPACAWAVLARERDARDLFVSLLARGRPAGQLYALCGLYFADPAAFREHIEPYRGRADEVRTFMGCLGGMKRMGELVEHTGPRAVRLASPKDTLRDWVKHDPGGGRGIFLDIYGGGYPATFRALRPCRGVDVPRGR